MAINSKGLSALSHFRNSRTSMSLDEPVYKNLFVVEIQLPSLIGADNEMKNLLLEGVQKVSGLDTAKVPSAVLQHYKSSDRSFAGSGLEQTYLDVKFDFEINVQRDDKGVQALSQLKMLKAWTDLVYDPLSGKMGLKRDYVSPQINITLHDKAYNPLRSWTLYNAFPISNITPIDLDYAQKTEVYKVQDFTVRCDYWEEVIY